jgi:hypothetical protein
MSRDFEVAHLVDQGARHNDDDGARSHNSNAHHDVVDLTVRTDSLYSILWLY